MLLSELNKVIEIDDRISHLHRELTALYTERAHYVQHPNNAVSLQTTASKTHTGSTAKDTVQTCYQELGATWQIYGIAIPAFAKIKKSLLKAISIMDEVALYDPELANDFSVVLVPPSKLMAYPGSDSLRARQGFVQFADYVSKELPQKAQRKNWEMLVVYNRPEALEWGNAKTLLETKRYKLGSYDLRGLGIVEHIAFSLQHQAPVDGEHWTSLLKDAHDKTTEVASVTFFNGQYRYELDDVEGVFGDERFRPAIKVEV